MSLRSRLRLNRGPYGMSNAYCLASLKLVSDVELPELMPWTGTCNGSSNIFFRLGTVPFASSNHGRGDNDPVAGGSHYVFALKGGGKVLVENGRNVTIEPAPGTDLTEIRAVLMGPIQSVLWHQRGLLPLHASAVGLNGRAVALAGPSGAGKSSLAAMLSRRNLPVLGDDICIVATIDGATVLPSTSRLRLWRQALDHFGMPLVGLPRALSRREKYLIEGQGVEASEQQLAAVIILSRGSCREVAIRRVRGWHAFTALQSVVHMPAAARSLGLDGAIFAALVKLVAAGVTVWDLSVPDDLVCLEQAAESIVTTVDGCTS